MTQTVYESTAGDQWTISVVAASGTGFACRFAARCEGKPNRLVTGLTDSDGEETAIGLIEDHYQED